MPERGVSDVVGFVLIFALITSTVGMVYTFGFSGLEDARDHEQLSNAERVFDILADNIADLHKRSAPSRSTEMKLTDATITYGSETSLRVDITNLPSSTPTYSTNLDPIVYTASGTPVQLVYENGAIFRERHDTGGITLQNPQSVFRQAGNTKTVMLPFVQTRQTGSARVSGSSTVAIETEKAGSDVMGVYTTPADTESDPDGDGENEYAVTYRVRTSPTRAPLWETYLESQLSWNDNACSASGGDVTCTFSVERLYVTAVRVDVAFR